jgi:hypothetical protein
MVEESEGICTNTEKGVSFSHQNIVEAKEA